MNQEIEAKISVVERKINAIEFLLSGRRFGDPENPYIMVYEHYSIENLQTKENNLQTEKNNLQTKENILLQQQLAAVQGKIVRFWIYIP
jgi:hypothetical protein